MGDTAQAIDAARATTDRVLRYVAKLGYELRLRNVRGYWLVRVYGNAPRKGGRACFCKLVEVKYAVLSEALGKAEAAIERVHFGDAPKRPPVAECTCAGPKYDPDTPCPAHPKVARAALRAMGGGS